MPFNPNHTALIYYKRNNNGVVTEGPGVTFRNMLTLCHSVATYVYVLPLAEQFCCCCCCFGVKKETTNILLRLLLELCIMTSPWSILVSEVCTQILYDHECVYSASNFCCL